MTASLHAGRPAEAIDIAAASQAAELVRHPGHAARAHARWSGLRAGAQRLHATVRPRFVSTVLVLGGIGAAAMGVLTAALSSMAQP